MAIYVEDTIATLAGLDHADPHESTAYDHYDATRQVFATNLQCITNCNNSQCLFQLAYEHLYSSRFDVKIKCNADCVQCKTKKKDRECEFLGDSRASLSFTPHLEDYAEYEIVPAEHSHGIETAAKGHVLKIEGLGTVIITHAVVDKKGVKHTVTTCLHPIFHIPGIAQQLLSLGQFLQEGYTMTGDKSTISFWKDSRIIPRMSLHPHEYRDMSVSSSKTIYWLSCRVLTAKASMAMSMVKSLDYHTMHQHFGHASKKVLRHAPDATVNYPKGIKIPTDDKPCRGCAEGKMPSRTFSPSDTRATKPFEKIHMDLKSFPVDSYHKFKYYVLFYDDYTSCTWVQLLKRKSDTKGAIRRFVAMVKTQYGVVIKSFMVDKGGEFDDAELLDELAELGIKIFQSVPYQPQQNGRAECFNRTLMDKAQAMHLAACLPPSWWEFCILHAVHIHNRTPMERINWMMPIGLLTGKKPDVSLLRVFGCGAYVLIPPERRINKLAPKSQYMTYLGFVDGIKGFLFMNSENRLVTGATALFDEKDFPCCKPGTQFRGDVPLWDENIEPNIPLEDDDQDDKDFTIPHNSRSQPPPEEPSDSDDFYEETPSNHRGLSTPKAGENPLPQTPRPP